MIQFPAAVSSRKAAIALSVFAFAANPAIAEVSALVGGDTVTGDQATIALDVAVPQAFSYSRPVTGGAVGTAYFNWHLFCAEMSQTTTQVTLKPRYQLPTSIGADVWKFPDVSVKNLTYQGAGADHSGGLGLVISESSTAGQPSSRCLSALPGASNEPGVSNEPWYANHGLFSNNFGDYIGSENTSPNLPPQQTPPSGPHQNLKVTAQTFPGFAGKVVNVVKLEVQFDPTTPTYLDAALVDAYNSQALSPPASPNATWCLLKPSWVEGDEPPANLCDSAANRFPNTPKETGPFVRRDVGFQVGFSGPFYVLVARDVGTGSATAGTPTQGFAVLHVAGGLKDVAQESQDWYTDDSVWYNY